MITKETGHRAFLKAKISFAIAVMHGFFRPISIPGFLKRVCWGIKFYAGQRWMKVRILTAGRGYYRPYTETVISLTKMFTISVEFQGWGKRHHDQWCQAPAGGASGAFGIGTIKCGVPEIMQHKVRCQMALGKAAMSVHAQRPVRLRATRKGAKSAITL